MKNNDKCFIPLVGFNFMSTRIQEGNIASQINLISKSLWRILFVQTEKSSAKTAIISFHLIKICEIWASFCRLALTIFNVRP